MRKKNDHREAVECPHCRTQRTYKNGISKLNGQQRYICRECRRTFQTEHSSIGVIPDIRKKVLELHLDGYLQTEIHDRLGLSKSTISMLVKDTPRGNPHPPCPTCQSRVVIQFGRSKNGLKKRYRCKQCTKTFSQ